MIGDAPRPLQWLSEAARAHFDAVQAGLTRLGIPFEVDTALVRGLDYYTRTVFEFVGEAGLGAQSTVAAGGRYDGLVETLGGRPTPAVGFAAGIERLLMMMSALGVSTPAQVPGIYLVGADDEGRAEVDRIAFALRLQGLAVGADVRGRSVKAQMKAVIGSGEVAAGTVKVKTMGTGDVTEVALDAVAIAALLR